MAQNTHTQAKQKPQPSQRTGSNNDHNEREHQERLARQEKNLREGTPGGNEHNRKEHEEKLKREKA
jgi:hypothetical protein